MPQHTPAPWKTDLDQHDQPHQDIKIMSGGMSVAKVWQDDACFDLNGEQRANAKHIVKCVNLYDELLEALENILESVKSTQHDYTIDTYAAEKTIAKARGEA